MDLGLAGKVAVVAAGSRGLGLAAAVELAREGAHVALCARGAEDLKEAVAQVDAAGPGKVLPELVDVTDDASVRGFLAEVERGLGPPDLLLINAGGPPAGGVDAHDLDAWEAAYRLNLESAVRWCRLVVPGMRARRFGRVVQITSVTVKQPVAGLALSNVLRPAAHALLKELAREAAADNVTLNSVAPGFHRTSAIDRIVADRLASGQARDRAEVLAGWEREIPAGRLGEPAELAALVAFLMSERAGYITGQLIAADGGWVRGTF
ncbi:MAG TPA: SDR family oxidoreductase [Candidatus Krumholzibacteria bacterium]|nr:SDR family oxidoreductase [Candidatus Krumholzibacteria bacterium]